MSLAEVAAYLHLKPSVLRRYCNEGRIAHSRIGHTVTFVASDVVDFLNAHRHVAQVDPSDHGFATGAEQVAV